MKLSQYVSLYGTISRRQLFQHLKEGRVQVNRQPVTAMTHDVHPSRDRVVVDGKELKADKMPAQSLRYFKFNKPKDVISTMTDPKGRRCLSHFLEGMSDNVLPVGRLDRHTTGLMIMTNDGQLAHRILHPRYQLRKVYRVTVDKRIHTHDMERLVAGIDLEDGPVAFDRIDGEEECVVVAALHEGRNRIVRRSFEALGYDVVGLKRIAIGQLTLGKLKPGEFKPLTPRELKTLQRDLSSHS